MTTITADTLTITTRWGEFQVHDTRRPGSLTRGSVRLPDEGIVINRVTYTGWIALEEHQYSPSGGVHLSFQRLYRNGDYFEPPTDAARKILTAEFQDAMTALLPPLSAEDLHAQAVASVVDHVQTALKQALNYEAWSHLRGLDRGKGEFDRDRVMNDARPVVMALLADLTEADVLHY